MTTITTSTSTWAQRFKASGIHLGLSLTIAALSALLVFGLWYPYPYREISGGRELFLLLVTVDVILGPLITLAIFNHAKGWHVLRRDLMVIAVLQIAALGYGLWTVFVARPVHLVFEYHRFNVVHAIDVPTSLLPQALPGFQAMPLLGPTTISLRPFASENEKADMTVKALQGLALPTRPELWQPYSLAKAQIQTEAKALDKLKARFPQQQAAIDETLRPFGAQAQTFVWLPMVGRKTFWTVFLDPATTEIKAFMPLDSF
jgi:hypothetical protein